VLTAILPSKNLAAIQHLNETIGIPIAFLLIPQFGMLGVIPVAIIAGVPRMFIGLYWTWKRYGIRVDFQASSKTFLASAIAAAVAYLFLSVLNAAGVDKTCVRRNNFSGNILDCRSAHRRNQPNRH
jgi:hypothetical protein